MADKNFKSYEAFKGVSFRGVQLNPDVPSDWNDTMKVHRCEGCVFDSFEVRGAKEDCLDIGRETNDCLFHEFVVKPTGQYIVTCKGGSNYNHFRNWTVCRHGKDVDFEFGNWHSYNFDYSKGNVIDGVRSTDGKPITYCYRWGCRPTVVNTHAKHLWWRSIGLTVYWGAKYIWHRILNRPDNF